MNNVKRMQCCGVLVLLMLFYSFNIQAQDILFNEKFDTQESAEKFVDNKSISFSGKGGVEGNGCLKFSLKSKGDSLCTIPLEIEKIRGGAIQVEGYLKAENIAIPSPRYFGPKLMLNIKAPGEDSYSEQKKIFGSHDWKKFRVFARVPSDAQTINLILGIQKTSGTLYMNNVKVIAVPLPQTQTYYNTNETLQRTTKYRGMMSGNNLTESDISDFAEKFGANLMRWQFKINKDENSKFNNYLDWIDSEIKSLDELMPAFKKNNIKVVIDMHAAPGGSQDKFLSNSLSWNIKDQDLLVKGWEKIAKHYKGNKLIYGYDLLNEPKEDNYVYELNGALDWNNLSLRIAKAIRDIDPNSTLVIEPAKIAMPAGLKTFRPLPMKNIIYSIHYYHPHTYSHQGINGVGKKIIYPGIINGKKWDIKTIRNELKPAIEFQKKYNVPIYVGEFSAIRWAPGAAKYIEDCIEVFEENGWDWTYHAFREWNGWSVEHDEHKDNNSQALKETAREKVLKKWFAKNIGQKCQNDKTLTKNIEEVK